ncbi:MAG: tetratricopeptide repeat protein [Salinivirgaceae bacterium]|nr:tetratricopeptide repeat protein [Salinivirgaceae bacterium]
MKNILFLTLLVSMLVVSSCKQDPRAIKVKEITEFEKQLYEAKTLDRKKGMDMIDIYSDFSKEYPKDSLSAKYLFKAAEVAMNLQLGSQSIYFYDKVMASYPDFYKVPECLFLKAFIFENQLENLEKAETYYKQFIKEYPNHALAKDAEASLNYLGKSPEELVKMFQEMNKEE